jgi:hypothetical protein
MVEKNHESSAKIAGFQSAIDIFVYEVLCSEIRAALKSVKHYYSYIQLALQGHPLWLAIL